MLEFYDESTEIYNGYLKYYNTPSLEMSKLENIAIVNEDGRTKVTFDREVAIDSINNNDLKFDLNECNYVAIATGDLIDNLVKQHTETPIFSKDCYKIANNIELEIETTVSDFFDNNVGSSFVTPSVSYPLSLTTTAITNESMKRTSGTDIISENLPEAFTPTITVTSSKITTNTIISNITTAMIITTESTTTESTTIESTTTVSTTTESTTTESTTTESTTTESTTTVSTTTESTTTVSTTTESTTTESITTESITTESTTTESTTTESTTTESTTTVLTTKVYSTTAKSSTPILYVDMFDYYFNIDMKIREIFTDELSDPNSDKYKSLNIRLKKFVCIFWVIIVFVIN